MQRITRERQHTYEVGTGFTMPEVFGVSAELNRVVEADRLELDSIYYDTAEFDLLRNGVTLRRRRGPVDEGWQLKLPDEHARIEIAVAPRAGGVPRELSELVLGIRAGHPLKRAARLQITRSVQRLLTTDGQVMATLSDDDVHATVFADRATANDWREIDVELGPAGDESLARAIGTRLIRSGAEPSAVLSKLARALATGDEPHADQPAAATAGGVLLDYLAAQRTALLIGDMLLRAGQDDGARLRGAAHRIRNAVRVCADLVDEDRAAALDEELRWLLDLLANLHRGDAIRTRLASDLARLPDAARIELTATKIAAIIDEGQQRDRAALARALRGERYLALIGEVARWASVPPLTDAADATASTLSGLVDAAEATMVKKLHQVTATHGEPAALRRAAKSIRRLRDADEVAERAPRSTPAGRHDWRRFRRIAQLLARHHDAERAAVYLSQLIAAGGVSGADGFAYGALYHYEVQAAQRARTRAIRAILALPASSR